MSEPLITSDDVQRINAQGTRLRTAAMTLTEIEESEQWFALGSRLQEWIDNQQAVPVGEPFCPICHRHFSEIEACYNGSCPDLMSPIDDTDSPLPGKGL